MSQNFLFLLLVLIITCCTGKNDAGSVKNAYLGGEIINRTNNYVLLKRKRKIIDTIRLDDKNRFKYTIKNVNPGLYYFHYGVELQSILIEPGDSLMLRLNTYDFDESIAYGGIGGKENNYLMRLFLENEKEVRDYVIKHGQLDPKLFQEKINSYKNARLGKLEKFNIRNNTSKLFRYVASNFINYTHYNAKEFYPFANYKKNELEIFNSIPKDFYDYRNKINYNDTILAEYFIYNSFLRLNINNIALRKHFKHSSDSIFEQYSLDYNLAKLNIIDSLVTYEAIKNRLLFYHTSKFINSSQNISDYKHIAKSFTEKSTNKKQIKAIKRNLEVFNRIKPGESIPEIILYDSADKEVAISKLVKNSTVFYFWDLKNKNHIIHSHKRVKELKTKYPEFDFIAISLNEISSKEQYEILERLNIESINEYRFKFPKKALKKLGFMNVNLNKSIVVDKNGKIITPRVNMFTLQLLDVLSENKE